MQIGDILNTYNSNLSPATGGPSQGVSDAGNGSAVSNGTKGVEQAVKTTETLSAGNIFEGTINSVDGNKVTIGLSNGQTVTARLDSGVSLADGQSVFFQVKSNDGQTIQIKPVSTDLNGNPTLTKALDAASVAVNERTLNMVNTMMKEQMPIDAASLNNMNRILMNNPDINPNTIVTMTKLQLPMSIEMANQFEAYQTNQAQITSDLKGVMDAIPSALTDSSLSAQQTVELNNNLLSAFGVEPKAAESIADKVLDETTAEQGTVGGKENVTVESTENNSQNVAVNKDTVSQSAGTLGELQSAADESTTTSGTSTDKTSTTASEMTGESGIADNNQTVDQDKLSNVLTDKNYTNLNNVLKEFPGIRESEPGLFDDKGNLKKDVNTKDFLAAVMDYTNKNPDISKEKMDSLLGSNSYKKILNNVAEKSWTITPKDIAKEGEVEKLYERILKQANDIIAASEKAGKGSSELSKAANDVKSNVNFMNQVNELYNFVQIPVKLANQTANSDLYVFQNKKKNYEEGDELSAFLHFDLDHLGSTDITVKMQRKNVSCDWVLEKEDSLKLIEANLDKLEARLNAKGYNCSFSAKSGENDFNFVDDFLKQDDKPAGMVHRYSFDMKA